MPHIILASRGATNAPPVLATAAQESVVKSLVDRGWQIIGEAADADAADIICLPDAGFIAGAGDDVWLVRLSDAGEVDLVCAKDIETTAARKFDGYVEIGPASVFMPMNRALAN